MEETIASRLRRLRKEKRLSQVQLANLTSVGPSAIGNVESGLRGYGKSVIQVAAALGTSPEYLLLETDDPTPTAPAAAAISDDGERFAHWLSKIKNRDLRDRARDAAMQIIYGAIDGQWPKPPESPTPEPAPQSKKQPASRLTR